MLTTWATAAIIPLVFRVNLTVLPEALKWTSIAGVGLAAGLAARGWLSQRTPALRLVVAFLSLSGGLWLSGYLTQGHVGYRLFSRPDIAVDWIGLGQLTFGCLAAGLALYAWRISPTTKITARKPSDRKSRKTAVSTSKRTTRKTIKSGKPARPQKPEKSISRLHSTRKRAPAANRSQSQASARRSLKAVQRTIRANQQDFLATQKNFWATRRNFWGNQRRFWENAGTALNYQLRSLRTAGQTAQNRLRLAGQGAQTRLRATGRALQNRLNANRRAARTRIDNRLAKRPGRTVLQTVKRQPDVRSVQSVDSPVRLIGETEHRCPYCLEVVVNNDPRGVKVCPICHTRHHADCWAVTGNCQVPHQYE